MIIFKNDWRYELENINYTEAVKLTISRLPEECHPGEAAEIEFDLVSITRDDPAARLR